MLADQVLNELEKGELKIIFKKTGERHSDKELTIIRIGSWASFQTSFLSKNQIKGKSHPSLEQKDLLHAKNDEK